MNILAYAASAATPVRQRKRLGGAVAILLFVFSSISSFGSDTEFVNWQHLDDTLHGIDYNITTNFHHYFRLNEAGTLPDGSSFLQQDFRGSVSLPLVARYFSNQAIISVLSSGFNGLKQYVVDVANGIHRDPLKLNVTDSISYTVQSNNVSRVISRLDSGVAVTNRLTVTDHDLAATITNRVERLVNVISKGVAVTNVVDVRSSTLANAISNQTDRVVDSLSTLADTLAGKDFGSGSFSFNTNYVKDVYNRPTTSMFSMFQVIADSTRAKTQRTYANYAFPQLTGDFLSDSIAVLRYIAYTQLIQAQGDIKIVGVLDAVTNQLQYVNENITGFKNQNHFDLTAIQSQDKYHYDSFEELKAAILSWIDQQHSDSEESRRQADEVVDQVQSYQPESGDAGEQSFVSEDLTTKITSFDSLVNELAGRSCPQTLVIRFGGWSLFGAEVSDDPIVIPLSRVQNVLDFIRMGFCLLWYGLSLLVMWWLVRLVVSLQHKVITWTFTTTNGPQS